MTSQKTAVEETNGKASALSLLISSKCTALVEVHVNRQTYALASSVFHLYLSCIGDLRSPHLCV